MIPKLNGTRIQPYPTFFSFKKRSESFWLEEESQNNLFWEESYFRAGMSSSKWRGNVFSGGNIELSAAITQSSYLLLSFCEIEKIDLLIRYFKRADIKVSGVLGPAPAVARFCRGANLESTPSPKVKKFRILEKSSSQGFEMDDWKLQRVGDREWPRARIWAIQFVEDNMIFSNPTPTISLAKKMMEKGDLFFLRNERGEACAMAGFGRKTPNKLVINMVFVSRDQRGRGLGKHLVQHMLDEARLRKYSSCILFSDYEKPDNLYEQIGFSHISDFVERTI